VRRSSIKLRKLGKKAKTAGIYLGGNKMCTAENRSRPILTAGRKCLCFVKQILKKINFILGKNDYVRQIGVWVGNLQEVNKLRTITVRF
jgi:hypothetical protein